MSSPDGVSDPAGPGAEDSAGPDAAPASAPHVRPEPAPVGPAGAQRLMKLVSTLRSQSANVVGITGTRSGVGVSVTSRALAEALSIFGLKALLIDLSRAVIGDRSAAESDLAPAAVNPSLSVLTIAPQTPVALSDLRKTLQSAAGQGSTVVIDLPPVLLPTGAPAPTIAALGELCDAVLVVCLSGETTQKDIAACVEACTIIGIKPTGLVVNDWRMPLNGLIAN